MRRSPDELLADVGDRARRTEPVAELLRPLAESMRRDWRLSSVRIWTGPPGRLDEGDLECATIVPAPLDGAPPAIPLSAAERGLLARVGVAGPGWLRMWLPRLVPPTPEPPQMRFAPAVDGSRVLGLVVIERAADAAAFTGADERALAAVAGRLAIELRSRALDEALQATLVDLRKSNAELQASRVADRGGGDGRAAADRARPARRRPAAPRRARGRAAAAARRPAAPTRRTSSCSTSWTAARGRPSPSCATSRTASTRRCCATPGWPRRCGRWRPAARSPITVVDERPERAAEPVEVAVYFCCLEALQNVAKHAPDARVTIGLATADGALFFTVVDDGPGFDPAAAARGAGLTNMADRLGAVGGTLRIRSSPGAGTEVSGRVPVGDAHT